ncbi:hypothetical protein [Nonomuraea typhae]|uniref:hypothetical protein n=1 Tax=Nonomuraea typhae TaxID=2603600 RepID=UPI0012F8A3E5|nr:hypothetical protein [Nonomuraea typhae]
MSDRLDQLERRIDDLRAGVRRAMRARDTVTARTLRADLRAAERTWDALVSTPADTTGTPPGSIGPPPGGAGGAGPTGGATTGTPRRRAGTTTVRERVHQALDVLGAPAQPRLIVAVSEAFFAGALRSAQLTSLRRDEERSFRASPYGRPYYLCAALTDRLSSARGLLTLSAWPLERRVVGPLSPRVDFLTCAAAVAERIGRTQGPSPEALRLVARMGRNIPGGELVELGKDVDPGRVAEMALAELAVHIERDTRDRAELAARARDQLDDPARLFGVAPLSAASLGAVGNGGITA